MRVTTKTRSCIVTVTLITILPTSFRRRPNPWDHHSISPAKHLSKVVGWAGLFVSNWAQLFDREAQGAPGPERAISRAGDAALLPESTAITVLALQVLSNVLISTSTVDTRYCPSNLPGKAPAVEHRERSGPSVFGLF
jgi:hypothetical protein